MFHFTHEGAGAGCFHLFISSCIRKGPIKNEFDEDLFEEVPLGGAPGGDDVGEQDEADGGTDGDGLVGVLDRDETLFDSDALTVAPSALP